MRTETHEHGTLSIARAARVAEIRTRRVVLYHPDHLGFLVQTSRDPERFYLVTWDRRCCCPAWNPATHCKHVAALTCATCGDLTRTVDVSGACAGCRWRALHPELSYTGNPSGTHPERSCPNG